MKKKIVIASLIVCILVLSIASTTMAYFTDTKSMTNTFTTGDVKIKLTEAEVKKNELGHLVEDTDKARIEASGQKVDFGTIFPMQTIYKDPTITNMGSEDAYVAAIISITGIGDLITSDANNVTATQIAKFIFGGAIDENAQNHVRILDDVANGNYTIYVIVKNALVGKDVNEDNGGEVTLFNTIHIPDAWDNAEMAKCADLQITVDAYATQVAGFADAKTAITTAFATEFGSIFTTNP